MASKFKVLILVPATTARGGISNYYQVLRNEFTNNIVYFIRGARTWPVRNGFWGEIVRAWKDYLSFKVLINKGDFALVQSSTSLGLSSVIRDGMFLSYSRRRNIKTIAFFRGWDVLAQQKLEKRYLWLFKYFFFKCNSIIVLSEKVKKQLQIWGFKGSIFVETTLVDKVLLSELSKKQLSDKYDLAIKNSTLNILFLSRIEKRKGIYELLQAFAEIQTSSEMQREINLRICGDGFELENIRNLVNKSAIKNVTIEGFVQGEIKKAAFNWAHLFVFPSHGEGMPNAVLEAMGFGLPVITTPVGGLVDIFTDNRNGYFIDFNNPSEIKARILQFSRNQNSLKEMSSENYYYAESRFRSDRVALRIKEIFEHTINN